MKPRPRKRFYGFTDEVTAGGFNRNFLLRRDRATADETERFSLTRGFLLNHGTRLRELFRDR